MQQNSDFYLSLLAEQERLRSKRYVGVKTVLVVLSSHGMAFDTDGLRSLIQGAYPEAKVFFMTTKGKPFGPKLSGVVDLAIDFTGPGQRQGWFFARGIRRMARYVVGRHAGLFRKRIYDRVIDEKSSEFSSLSKLSTLAREKEVQTLVLNLAGVASIPHSESAPDRGREIALKLPPLAGR
jgi:hypothetical protein